MGFTLQVNLKVYQNKIDSCVNVSYLAITLIKTQIKTISSRIFTSFTLAALYPILHIDSSVYG